MKQILILYFLLTVSFSVTSQVEMHISCGAMDYKTKKNESGVTVRIYDGGSVIANGVTGANGKLLLKVPTEKVYKIEFSKSGKVTRFATINSKNIDVELLQGSSIPDVRVDVSMFEEVSNIDYNYIENTAITEFYFDGKNSTLAYNKTTADRMAKEVEKAMQSAENNSGNVELQFQAKMKEAEALAAQNKYGDAAKKFEQALFFKPTDKVANKRLQEMDALAKAEKVSQIDGQALNSEFDNLVKAAEILKSQKKYQEAIDKYEEALQKKDDQNVSDEIDDLMVLIRKEKKEKEAENSYTTAMTAVEALMKQKSYQAALDQIQIALKAKPGDAIATKKKTEVEGFINAAKGEQERKKSYELAVGEADELFKAEKWLDAKTAYEKALTFESSSQYASSQVTKIKSKIDELEKEKLKKQQIETYLSEGLTAFNSAQWEPAKTKYLEVQKLDPTNKEAADQLKVINDKIEEIKQNSAKDAAFKKLVDEGDALVKTAKYGEAIVKYTDAVNLKEDAAVSKKITDANAELEKVKNQKETKQKFDLAMKEGESLLVANKLEDAKVKFQEAADLDKNAQLPKDKLKLVGDKIAAEQALRDKAQKYADAMAEGESLLTAGKLVDARASFFKAKEFDKTQTAPDLKIKNIDDQLKLEASQKEKTDKYNAAIKAGDDLRKLGKLLEAKAEYQKAKGIDGTLPSADLKIKEVEDEMASQADAKALKDKADKYAASLKIAAELRKSGKLVEAKAEYNKAKGIDNSQSEPDTKIAEIDQEIEAQTKLVENKKQIEKLLKEGSDLIVAKSYDDALAKYNAVLEIDKSNVEAPKKILEIEAKQKELKSAQQKAEEFKELKNKGLEAFNAEKWEESKKFFTDAKKLNPDPEIELKLKDIDNKLAQIATSQGLEAEYKKIIEEAAKMELAKDYDNAIKKYQTASDKRPTEDLPKSKIKELQLLKLQQEAQAQIDLKYNASMKKANDAFISEDYPLAIKLYNEANSIKPTEKEPVDKAEEARQKYEAQNVEFKIKYEKMLVAAQNAIDEKNWDKAIDLYNRAIVIKKDDPLPKTKLGEIENLRKADELEKNALAAKDKLYAQKLSDAEVAIKANQFDKAIGILTEAKKIKPTETFPDSRIEEVNRMKSDFETIAKSEEMYTKYMKSGDNAVIAKEYSKALSEYNNALNVKGNDKIALAKIAEVQQLIDNETNAAKEEKKKSEFNELIKTADGLFNAGNWQSAKDTYNAALDIVAKDVYATAQVKKCDSNLKSQNDLDAKYQKIIKEADAKFDAGDYPKAKELYTKALTLKKGAEYPTQRLQEIEDILNPKVVQSGPLPNLGTPNDNSLIEGQALLALADANRKNAATVKMSAEVKSQQENVSNQQMSRQNTNLDIESGIQEIEKQRTINAPSDDESRKLTVEAATLEGQRATNNYVTESNFEFGDVNDISSKVVLEKQGMEANYAQKHNTYNENTKILKASTILLQNTHVNEERDVYNANVSNQVSLNLVDIKVAENTFDDYELRKVTETDVRVAQTGVNKNEKERYDAAFEKSFEITKEVYKNKDIYTDKEEKDTKLGATNKEDLKVIQEDLLSKDFATQNKQLQTNQEVGTKIDNERVELSHRFDKSDDHRQENVETIEAGGKELDDLHRNQFNDLFLKSLKNQGSIATERKSDDHVPADLTSKQEKDVAVYTQVEKQIRDKDNSQDQFDESKRLETTSSLSKQMVNSEVKNTVNSEKGNENKVILDKSDAISQDKDKTEQAKQIEKNYNARKLIDQIESKEIKFDEAAANALGTSYPEGVSQESFNQNGNDGLLVAIVTRRIVVKNGHGDVYVRKQTLSGLTYSKNGEPSSEYIWQKETGDGKLKRNY